MAKKRFSFGLPKFKHPYETCRTAKFTSLLLRIHNAEQRARKMAAQYFPKGTAVLVSLRDDATPPLEAEIVVNGFPTSDGAVVKFRDPTGPLHRLVGVPASTLDGTWLVSWYRIFLPTDWTLREELRNRRGWTYEEKKPKRKRRRKGAA